MEKICVGYWYSNFEEKLKIPQGALYEYSPEKRNEIIDLVLDAGMNVMLQQNNEKKTLIIWIDDKRFCQR